MTITIILKEWHLWVIFAFTFVMLYPSFRQVVIDIWNLL